MMDFVSSLWKGAIQVLRNAVGGGRVSDLPEKKRYEDVRFNFTSVTRGRVGVEFPEKKRYITLEWSQIGGVNSKRLIYLRQEFVLVFLE